MDQAARSQKVERVLLELGRQLRSDAIVTDPEILASYGGDESEAEPVTPQAVIRAGGSEDVQRVLQAANRHGVPVTARGGGTGRTGGAVPLGAGIVLAFEQAAGIKGIEKGDFTATVEPGLVLQALHEAVEAEGLFYPPDPNSLASCTVGGNVAENAAGPRTLRYGTTRDYVLGMHVVTGAGTPLYVGRRTIKGVTGYDLTSLLVGSEGTLAVTTEITVKLLPRPQAVVTMLVLLPDLPTAGRAVGAALGEGFVPRCMEMLDGATLELIRPQASVPIPPDAGAMLLVELDGDQTELDHKLERCGNAMDSAGAQEILVARHGSERERLWAARRELSRALRSSARYKLAEDVVVPRSRIPDLIDACRAISEALAIPMPSYGHAGDGNIHVNFLWNEPADRPRVDKAISALFHKVLALGGTLSGEHGIGILKAPYLEYELSQASIALQEQLKTLFDPQGILNPGKIFPHHLKRFHGPC